MNITVILPVSRTKYLDRVLDSLKNQTYKADGILVVHDGPAEQFAEVRNKILGLDFDNKLCVQSTNEKTGANIPDRRRNIANIHNQIRGILPPNPTLIPEGWEPDWLFSIEDDGILPPDALERLVKVVEYNSPKVGMATGVELGRWGSPYVGAWTVDNPDNVKQIESVANRSREGNLIQQIDASGLYCALIRSDKYKEHEFFTHNGLGPDVNLGIFLRQQGLSNYLDWDVQVTHLTSFKGLEVEISPTDNAVKVSMRHLNGNVWQIGS